MDARIEFNLSQPTALVRGSWRPHDEEAIASVIRGQNGEAMATVSVENELPAAGPTDQAMDTASKLNAHLLGVASADKAAFKIVFEHFAPRLKSFIMRQGSDPNLAEEVVQETMVKVWRKAAQFDPAKASAATWIYTIARNVRIDLLRKINRPEPDMEDPALVGEPEPLPHDIISGEQQAARLRDVVSALPEEQRDVLRLAFFEEKAHPEVAAELGIPLGTVKSRIRLAFKRIRKEFGEVS